jgi:hypothetical protein
MTLPRWKALVVALPTDGAFEVVLHPGVDDPQARQRYPWGYRWEEESAALESEELRLLLESREVETVPFSLLASG